MIIAAVKVSVHFSHSRSLKEKRGSLKSIIEKIKHRYNVSIAEIADQNLWQKATIGITFVSIGKFQAEKQIHEIRKFIESLDKGTISEYNYEILKEDV